ncbi:unnamed protein product [Rotaria magnacalcarata]
MNFVFVKLKKAIVAPSIRAQSTLIHSNIGKSIHLRCSASAPYDTLLYWRRIDNHNISNQSPRFRQQQNTHGQFLHTTLYIKDVERTDFGLYACYAESKAGHSKAVIELKEHHRLTTTIHTSTVPEVLDSKQYRITLTPTTTITTTTTTTTTIRAQLLKRNKISDQTSNITKQAHLGRMSLITLMKNLPDKILPIIPEIIYDENSRYLKLKDDNLIRNNLQEKSIKYIERDNESINDVIQQRPLTVSPSPEQQMTTLSIKERYECIANEFKLSSFDIEIQYKLALKNRIEIPPILMHRIIIDAMRILRIMIDELNQDREKNDGKFQRITTRLNDLEAYNKLFKQHCS